MSILITVVLTLVFCLTPALVLWLCRRFPMLGKVGPIMVLYAIGMIIGNLPVLPAEIKPLQDMIPNIMVPLAIPMMLFGCTFSRKELRLQVKLCASGFLSVCIAVVVGYLLFGRNVEPNGTYKAVERRKSFNDVRNEAMLLRARQMEDFIPPASMVYSELSSANNFDKIFLTCEKFNYFYVDDLLKDKAHEANTS